MLHYLIYCTVKRFIVSNLTPIRRTNAQRFQLKPIDHLYSRNARDDRETIRSYYRKIHSFYALKYGDPLRVEMSHWELFRTCTHGRMNDREFE